MKPLDRNIGALEHIVVYCQQIEQTVDRFGNNAETFRNDPIYRNAAALCILQIGELVGKLTDEFREQHPAVPWRQIKAMRNIVAHSYGTVDPEITWEIITDEIPQLKAYCEQIIGVPRVGHIAGMAGVIQQQMYLAIWVTTANTPHIL